MRQKLTIFPTVEPFSGAATGAGEIRDRMAGGQVQFPCRYSCLYDTHPRFNDSTFGFKREWLYQKPREILVKASNGASDFGNKFGQPLLQGHYLHLSIKKMEIMGI